MPRRIWLMLHEPRAVTATMIVAWSVCTGIGLAALVMPPASLAHQIGPLLTVIWAALLLSGGTLGGAGCAAGWWWAERSGIRTLRWLAKRAKGTSVETKAVA